MATSGTYYLNGPDISSATSVYTDAALTIIAADGWYSDGSIIRELVGGVFTNIISSCAPCASKCSPGYVSDLGDYKSVIYLIKDLKTTSVDIGAVVVTVELSGANPPFGFFVEYNGVQYNAVSSDVYGLLQGPAGVDQPVYIGEAAVDCGIVAAGIQSVPVYNFNPVTNIFDNTGQTETVQALAPQLQLTLLNPGKCVMVIPKPTATPSSLFLKGFNLCGLPASREVHITVECPKNLPSFTSTVMCAVQADTCVLGTDQIYYHTDTNSSTFLDLYDLVFEDPIGQTPLSDGWYRSPSVQAPDTSFQVVDGVIVGFGSCFVVTGYPINYEVENAISGSCAANVTSLTLKISQPPKPEYVDVIAPSAGTQGVPAGITHVQLELLWNEVYAPCGRLKMVIEKDGTIIAIKTFPVPADGTYEYLDVDFDLTASADIYAYITFA